ncbi:DNA-binding MarR family transcriptional regulator [Aurantimicrobium minutum]|uniref:MarR family winged helix-turn-helix transcriptional regulator n=1 Tax=Aurantimicrobium minutum TaxID=708131 RepID=UPI002475965C|nr:MarR family transcriptional regulator [Aurantimicrobium minutum]MDH6532582.1 DNA-binding MarR family transcriptional regulator [Aurantimicrobium minutum]
MTTARRYTGLLIRRAQQAHMFHWQRIVSSEISSPQFGVLSSLKVSPGLSQADLCAELDLDRSTIADIVQRLVDRGLISRERHAEDKRRYCLFLTRQGTTEYEALLPRVSELDAELTSKLTSQEHDELQVLLERLLEN